MAIVSGVDISVHTTVRASLAIVWREFNQPSSIMQWDAAPDWYTSWCTNDVYVGGPLTAHADQSGEAALGEGPRRKSSASRAVTARVSQGRTKASRVAAR